MLVKVKTSYKKRQLEVLQHFWHQGFHTAPELYKLTKIPISTIYYNIKKLKKNGTIKRKGGSGRVKKITPTAAKTILQYIHKEPSIPLKNIASKLKKNKVQVHYSTISRFLKGVGYKKALPLAILMLKPQDKINRVE